MQLLLGQNKYISYREKCQLDEEDKVGDEGNGYKKIGPSKASFVQTYLFHMIQGFN